MSNFVRFALSLPRIHPRHVHVLGVSAREKLSDLYRVEIRVATPISEARLQAAILGQPARLTIAAGSRTRHTHGIVRSIASMGAHPNQRSLLCHQIVLSPRLWLLGQSRTSRIFQDKSAKEVIEEVAASARVRVRFQLDHVLERRAYTTQYEESSLDLVKRLAAESGLVFWVEQPAVEPDALLLDALGQASAPLAELAELAVPVLLETTGALPEETIVFSDAAHYPAMGGASLDGLPPEGVSPGGGGATQPALQFREGGALETDDDRWFFEAHARRSVRPTTVVFRDFDPRRPTSPLEVRAEPRRDEAGPIGALEEEVGVGGHAIEVYAHGGDDLYPVWEHGARRARQMLDGLRRDVLTVEGEGRAIEITPGHTLRLEGHPSEEVNGEYVVVAVDHAGSTRAHGAHQASPYKNKFKLVPAHILYLATPKRRRSAPTCLTAVVVGPGQEKIHVNERGEVRVKFHWDRGGDGSCWIRTMQPWAGASFGTQFIPRVGSEVVVTFEGGNPDKPILLGSVYNGISPPPFQLPRHKTRTGILTSGDAGSSELSFDDEAGHERVLLRAQRDLEARVGRERRADVVGDDRLSVGGDARLQVAGDRSEHVAGSSETAVVGDERTNIGGRSTLHVAKNHQVDVDGDRITTIKGTEDLSANAIDLSAGSNVTTFAVGQSLLVAAGAATSVDGRFAVQAGGVVDISSDAEIVLRCGSSSIRISDGNIEIVSGRVTVAGKDARLLLADGDAKLKASGKLQVVTDDAIVLKASGASLGLQSEAKLDGAQVLLNSPTSATDSIDTTEPEPTTIKLEDQDGNPVANQPFRVVLDDGTVVSGVTDDEGSASVQVTGSGHIEFPNVVDVQQN